MELAELVSINSPYSYNEYRDLVVKLADEKKCTGEITQEHIDATFINAQRMKRIDKQCEINEELKNQLRSISKHYTWILIAESWCGDGAQCIPVIAKMAELNPNIELKLILRDENLKFMDNFLTNGARSIPKLIMIHKNNVITSWGARPKAIQNMVTDFKKANPEMSHNEFVQNLHLWYARDKTQSLQNEFIDILKQL